jgi:hypothetical protein
VIILLNAHTPWMVKSMDVWPVALKVAYTLLLLAMIGVLSREFYILWFDSRVFVGHFEIVVEGGEDTSTTDFASRVVSAQAVLAHQLADYDRLGDPSLSTDNTFPTNNERVALPEEALRGVEITIQNVNLTQIFSALRKGFMAPNEIFGNVTSTKGAVLAAVEWPRAPQPLGETNERLTKFYVPVQTSLAASAKYIACALSWARGAAQDENLSRIPRNQFCDYVMALSDLYELSEKGAVPNTLSGEESARVRRRIEILTGYYDAIDLLPNIYRLRADLIELLPDESRETSDLIDEQEDRLNYAMRSPTLANLEPEVKRYTVLALARPAIVAPENRLKAVPENWKSLLRRHADNVERALTSTAIVSVREKSEPAVRQMGTAFMVAPNLAITTSHVVGLSGPRGIPINAENALSFLDVELCFGDSIDKCTDKLKVSKIHYLGKFDAYNLQSGAPDIALLEVEGHSPVLQPPLPLIQPNSSHSAVVGSYAFVVGYPHKVGSHVPRPFLDKLLGDASGIRRVMPGRVLAFNSTSRLYTSDISTTGGTSGGALIDLSSGVVLAISFAGEWAGGRGKFAYALEIPKEVRHMIDRRISGEPIEVPDAILPEAPKKALSPLLRSRKTTSRAKRRAPVE